MMAYYKERVENEELLVKHAIIGITDDHQKGALGVKMFEKEAITIIEREKGKNLRPVHDFTDGCASQYKGKISFFDISKQKEPDVTRNFFETSHGMSVCAGLGAVVKGSCYHAVISGKEILGTAQDVMKYCENRLQVDKKVISVTNRKHVTKTEFIFINCGDVDRERPEVKTVQGTRKFHSIRSCGQELVIEAKHLSCYCMGCKEGLLCQNVEYVSAWEKKKLSVNTEIHVPPHLASHLTFQLEILLQLS